MAKLPNSWEWDKIDYRHVLFDSKLEIRGFISEINSEWIASYPLSSGKVMNLSRRFDNLESAKSAIVDLVLLKIKHSK